MGKSIHHVLNSKQLADDLADVSVEDDELWNSHDVVALFTNTPVELTLKIIRNRLEKDKDLKNRTRLTVDDLMELTHFVLTTTYFSFKDVIYVQNAGVAMGSPLSPIACNIFMEWLEEEAIATAPITCKPRFWKRYVDDVLEIIKQGQVENLTSHLNTIDPTKNIKFTHEPEQDGAIPFLDTLIIRKPDGSTKLCIYRKKTHTNQYLQFNSHHPLHQKLGVIRSLLDRKESIVTEEEDKKTEEKVICDALKLCGYPSWALDKAKKDKDKQQKKKDSKQTTTDNKSKGLVVVPYVEGLSEKASRVFKKHGFATAMKPHCTLRNMLVHPKDKRDPHQTAEIIYEIPCHGCKKSYIGESGRLFGTRLKEHKTEVDKVSAKSYTRAQRKASIDEQYKSAVTEHVAATNHAIGWDEAKVIDKEAHKTTRWLKEAIWIRRKGQSTLNKDEGAYQLNNIYDKVISIPPSTVSGIHYKKPVKRSDVI